jgi:hypothetical protein
MPYVENWRTRTSVTRPAPTCEEAPHNRARKPSSRCGKQARPLARSPQRRPQDQMPRPNTAESGRVPGRCVGSTLPVGATGGQLVTA